ncbi:hypothetical protein [Actinoplanes sp. NPDC049316]|uniref:hypothetical protein n=1 Tax=Actinoplanes sp. NPDC049316 TaxID=3154727 RepID=UPI003434CC39
MKDISASRRRRRAVAVVAGLAAAVVAVTAGAVAFWPSGRPAAVVHLQQDTASPPPTPFAQVVAILDHQAAALLAGDERGWLAPVDPKRPALLKRYRGIFRNLRGLDVRHVEYHAFERQDGKPGAVTANAVLGYCLGGGACPGWRSEFDQGPPKTTQLVTFEMIGGRYTITDLAAGMGAGGNKVQAAPWDGDELIIARGKRVTVAAPRSQKKNVRTVLAAAEKAAVVADGFAAYVNNPQPHYRVYLADDRAWHSWYGGRRPTWFIGYQLRLNASGADVVLRAGKVLKSRRQLAFTVQHELGHVVTLSGTTKERSEHQWLSEGIAEYIGAYPRKLATTGNWDVVAAEFRRRDAPVTIATTSLTGAADDRTVDRLYAMGHFAATCMAEKYGQRKLFAFTDGVLRRGERIDKAARAAYGRSFDTVDKACVTWIRAKVT